MAARIRPAPYLNLAHMGCAPLDFRFYGVPWRRRQLKNRGLLIFSQTCQEHDLAVRKFQRIVVGDDPFFIDLPKDRRLVLDDLMPPTRHTNRLARNLASKRQLGSWSNADRDARIF